MSSSSSPYALFRRCDLLPRPSEPATLYPLSTRTTGILIVATTIIFSCELSRQTGSRVAHFQPRSADGLNGAGPSFGDG